MLPMTPWRENSGASSSHHKNLFSAGLKKDGLGGCISIEIIFQSSMVAYAVEPSFVEDLISILLIYSFPSISITYSCMPGKLNEAQILLWKIL